MYIVKKNPYHLNDPIFYEVVIINIALERNPHLFIYPLMSMPHFVMIYIGTKQKTTHYSITFNLHDIYKVFFI